MSIVISIGLVDEIIDFVLEGVSDVGLCLNYSIFEAAFLFLAAVARNNHNVKQRCVLLSNISTYSPSMGR